MTHQTYQIFTREASRFGWKPLCSKTMLTRRYRAMFGVTPYVTSVLWNSLSARHPPKSQPRHLLWALLFLKVYASEHVHSRLAGVTEKRFRKWSWIFVRLVSDLKVVKLENRLLGREHSRFKMSVDGTDFRIQEPVPFSPKWYSHKFKGPGLRYEVGVGVHSAGIIWAHGPFPCGSFNDLRIFRLVMKHCLADNEGVIADGGYNDSSCSHPLLREGELSFGYIRARHEAVNKRLKQFGALGNRLGHSVSLHALWFYTVLNAVQLSIENGEAIFTQYGII